MRVVAVSLALNHWRQAHWKTLEDAGEDKELAGQAVHVW